MRKCVLYSLFMVMLISCRDREEKLQREEVPLSVSAGTVEYVARAGSTSSSAFQGALGVCLVDETGETYNGNVYSNVLYEYQDGTWSACDFYPRRSAICI